MPTLPTVFPGARGTYVELAQLALQRAGNSISTDGIFGVQTEAALQRFQTDNGIAPDGIIGPRTWRSMRRYLTGYTRHTVASGDTFYSIARRHGTTLRALRTANPGINPLYLQIGSTLIVPYGFKIIPFNISFTPTLLEFCLEGLTARYPFIAKQQVGSSVMGKPLWALALGEGGQAFYNASHHGNEWITTPALLRFIEDYSKAYSAGLMIGGVRASQLYNSIRLYVMPMVDPDGVSLVTGELKSGIYYENALKISADYPSVPFPAGWKANIEGIDLNLQYPAGWDRAKEIKFAQGFVSPAPRDYVGSAPLSAPESRAVYDFTLAHDFILSISLHTQGQVIFWKYLDLIPPGALETAEALADASGYAVEDTPYASGFAGYKDWFIERYFRRSYTVEAGIGISPLPLGQLEEIYSDLIGLFVTGLTEAASG